MNKNLEEMAMRIWAKSGEEEGKPRHSIFAEMLMAYFLEESCKAMCFHCERGAEVERSANTGAWRHIYRGEAGGGSIAECKAMMIKERFFGATE